MAVKRAFIAGAVCEGCGAMDRVQRCKNEGDEDYWMECVKCGWKQSMPTQPEEGPVQVNANNASDTAPTLKPLEHR